MSKQVQIKRQDIPSDWTVESADFINRVSSNVILKLNIISVSKENQLIDWVLRESKKQKNILG